MSLLSKKKKDRPQSSEDVLAEQLSFLPEQYLEKKKRRRTDLLCLSLFGVVLAGVGGAGFLKHGALTAAESEAARVSQEHVEAARLIEQVRQLRQRQDEMARQAELSASLLEKVPRSYLLAALTNGLPDPDRMALSDVELNAKQSTRPVAPSGGTALSKRKGGDTEAAVAPEPLRYDVTLRLSGVATDHGQVSDYMTKLKALDLFSGISDVETKRPPIGEDGTQIVEFAFELAVAPDAAADGPEAVAALAALETD
jgi:Tfp pilus assembly protein PilN